VYIINLLHTTQRCVYKILVVYIINLLHFCVYNIGDWIIIEVDR